MDICRETLRQISKDAGIDITTESILELMKEGGVYMEPIEYPGSYTFPSGYLNTRTSGLVAYPSGDFIAGVIVYFHGSVFGKCFVPSKLHQYYAGVIAYYLARKYAVILPDYIGLGTDYNNSHPYQLYPKQNIQNMAYAMNYSRPILASRFSRSMPFKTYSVGYSEGASYSLWLNLCKKYGCP